MLTVDPFRGINLLGRLRPERPRIRVPEDRTHVNIFNKFELNTYLNYYTFIEVVCTWRSAHGVVTRSGGTWARSSNWVNYWEPNNM